MDCQARILDCSYNTTTARNLCGRGATGPPSAGASHPENRAKSCRLSRGFRKPGSEDNGTECPERLVAQLVVRGQTKAILGNRDTHLKP